MRTIDTDKLTTDSSSLDDYISTLDTEVNKLNTSVSDNQNSFQGLRGTDFFTVLTDSYISDLKKLVSNLDSYQEFLKEVPKAYEMLDEEFGNKTIDV
ncbi:MAG: hypothetical protein J6D12_07870 [Peptostreptococcaceae bacterium]|nr:hypothetical protein [Peptostreptococcaceae bacterium]